MPRKLTQLFLAGASLAAIVLVLLLRPTDQTEAAADDPKPAVGTDSPRFVVHPYLQFATRTSIAILCETDVATTCVIEYGSTFPLSKSIAVEKPTALHEVKLTGLEPRTKYFYRVRCTTPDGQSLQSRDLTFATAVDESDAFSFTVIGDTQKNPTITAKLARLMWDRRPHFVLHMGDVVDNGPDKTEWTDELFGPCRELFARVPVYPCIGNHEKNHPHYYRYFSLPEPEYYYSFRYGNAEFFVLDTNKSPKPGDEQTTWLEQRLAASTATWKICFHHHPCYSSDSDDYGNTWKGYSKLSDPRARALVSIYEKHRVDLVLNGHIHLYERTWPVQNGRVDPTGVTYLTSGGGGGRLEDFDPTPAFFKNQGRVDYHFCYFTVHGHRLECRTFDHEGRLFDQFELRK